MKKMKNKSFKLNMVLNGIKGLMGILFPLISFPYVSRVLGVENLGRFNFASSVVSYFILVANLGITPYAIRECAKVRESRKKADVFASDIFTINLISVLFSIAMLVITVFSVRKLSDYRTIITILAMQIPLNLIGVEWVFSAFEDYFYITIRSIFFQFLSLILLFAFVKNENSLIIYSIITVVSAAGVNILNWKLAKKYVRIRIDFSDRLKKHMKPILLLFAMTVAGTVYSSTDMTILGFMCDDTSVGLYSVSTKVYNVVKTVISSIVVVSIPRLSAILGEKNRSEFSNTVKEINNILMTFAIPAMVGLVMLRKDIILLIAGKEYLKAEISLLILSVSLFFALGSYFWGQAVLIPLGKDKYVFEITAVFAIVNFVLNIALIPFFQDAAAAFTTLIAEMGSFFAYNYKARKYVNETSEDNLIKKIVLGCDWVVICNRVLLFLFGDTIAYVISTVILSVVGYFLIEYYMSNSVVVDGVLNVIKKVRS